MKNHITPLWKALPAAALLWHTLPAHGQVVTVPLACHVMVPGVGGTTGPGGDVGHGGIVMMRDPYAGGNFTFIGATGPQWTLLGDLSFPTLGTPPAPPVQGLATGLTQNIRSYNKILRQSEENTPSTNARSKGRVTIEYTLEECDQVMTFDIYKRWGDPAVDYYNFRYAPPIVGPDCWADGLITFSVDQVSSDNALDAIGFDQYYWMFTNMADDVLPSGAFYTSADRSSVTINQDSFDNPPFATWLGVGGPYTIQVCFGRANPWDGGTADDLVQATTGHTCVTKTIHAAPVEPVFTPPIPDCVSTGATAFPATITYDPVAGYTYDWACTNSSWTLTPGTGTLAVSTMDGNPGTLILTMTGPCGTQAYQYPVGRTFTSDQLVASETCVDAGGTVTITTGDSPLVPTCWTASPAGWGFVNNNAAQSSRTYTVPGGACAGSYTFTAHACDCPDVQSTVTVHVRPATPEITGPQCVPAGGGSPLTYTSTTPCGATGYIWSNTLGMTGTSTTHTIDHTPVGTASGVVTVEAEGVPGCDSHPGTLMVTRYPTVTQPACLNSGAPTPGAVFSTGVGGTAWDFPAGLTASAPGMGPTATINVIGTPGTYPSSATVNGCTTYFDVVIPAIPTMYETLVDNVSIPNSSLVYTTYDSDNCYRLWNCTSGSAVSGWTSASSSWQLTTPGAGSYVIQVDVNGNPCGDCFLQPECVDTDFSHMPTGGHDQVAAPGVKSAADDLGAAITISPNPSTGSFQVHIARDFRTGMLLMYDEQGRRVGHTTRLVPGPNTIHQEELAPGTYQVRMEIDGSVELRSVVIAR